MKTEGAPVSKYLTKIPRVLVMLAPTSQKVLREKTLGMKGWIADFEKLVEEEREGLDVTDHGERAYNY